MEKVYDVVEYHHDCLKAMGEGTFTVQDLLDISTKVENYPLVRSIAEIYQNSEIPPLEISINRLIFASLQEFKPTSKTKKEFGNTFNFLKQDIDSINLMSEKGKIFI